MDKNQKPFVSIKKFTSFICEKGYKKVKKQKTKFTMLQIPSPFFSFTFFSGGGGSSKIFKVPLFMIICGLSRNLGLGLLDVYLGKLSFV